jgi:hypothetical protein
MTLTMQSCFEIVLYHGVKLIMEILIKLWISTVGGVLHTDNVFVTLTHLTRY